MIDFSALKKALISLEIVLKEPFSAIVRDSAIQRFEYTYELAIKMIKRHLETVESFEIIDQLSFKDLMRMASEKGLLDNPIEWVGYRQRRNLTSHTYQEDKANEVFSDLPNFAKSSKKLLIELEKRNET